MTFGSVVAIGVLGCGVTFSIIFTATTASSAQINLMCWAFSFFIAASAPAASAQAVLVMTSPTQGEISVRSEKRWILTVILHMSVFFILLAVFFLGVAIIEKSKWAGIMAITFPAVSVISAIVVATYLNYIVLEEEREQEGK
jgi:hypothetical protein